MYHDFWKQSGSSLREEQINERNVDKKYQEPPVFKKDFFVPLHRLENAYGSLTFGVKKGRFAAMAARKSEFQDNTFDNSRKRLQLQRLQKQNKNGGTLWTDTHFQEESAAIYEEQEKDTAPEMILRRLRRITRQEKQKTWLEMLPQKENIENKVLQSLKKTRQEGKELPEEKKEETTLFHQILRQIETERIEEPQSEEEDSPK